MSDTLLRKAVVDPEFRAVLTADPAAFGVDSADLPAAKSRADERLTALERAVTDLVRAP